MADNRKKQWDREDERIRDFMGQLLEYQLSELPDDKKLQENYQLSDLFYQKMQHLIWRQEKMEKQKAFRRGITAAAAVLLLVFWIAVPEYAAKAANQVFEWFSDYVSFQFQEKADVNWVPRYQMGYVPKGYKLIKDAYYDAMGVIVYTNENGETLDLTYGLIDGDLHVDRENKELLILKGKGKQDIYYLKGIENNSSITWCSEDEITMFSLSGHLSQEELLKIYGDITVTEE